MLVLNFIALQVLNITGKASTKPKTMTVSQLYEKALANETVTVRGTVIRILPDYTSKKGYDYQQFYIGDGSEEIKIFCSERYGKVTVQTGDEVVVSGKYQKYYTEMEIYGYCSEIKLA